jgi:Putative neutral zinc metallopeptidase
VRKFLALLAVVLLCSVAVACGDDSGEDAGGSASANADDDSDGDVAETDEDGGFDIEVDEDEEEDLDNEDVIENVQEFWEDEAENIGHEYEEIPDDRISPVPSDDEVPECGGFEIQPEDVEANAFAAPCPEGLTVAWDPELIDETLTDQFGEAGPAVVFAHEWGHIIQYQSEIIDPTGQGIGNPPSVLVENQADCFAGAWVAQQVDDEYGPFADPGALDNSIGALLYVRDQPGSDPNAALAHGSGFDRVRAFQDGVDRGAEYCSTYVEDPPFIDELPFEGEDAVNQGNLEFDEVSELVIQDLDDYFGNNVDDFDEPGDPFDYVPQDDLEELHGEIGDGAVATVFGMIWAQRAQEAAGDDTDGEGPLLQRACLVGSWLGDILRDQRDGEVERESGVQLSPGDLDETIITFITLTEDAMSGGGVAFEAIFDMRQGVFGGIEDCRLGE